MPKITKLEEQKKRAGRINIYIDDTFAFGISDKLLLDYDLYKGKELKEKDIKKIKEAENISKCLDKAYRFLSFRPRSEKEMREKLGERFEEDTVFAAITKLKKYNYINDADFARMWVSSRSSGRSAKALAFELKRKGIERSIIDDALVEIDSEVEFKSAIDLVRAKSKYFKLEKVEAYPKIGGFLARRGYNYDIIKRVISELYPN